MEQGWWREGGWWRECCRGKCAYFTAQTKKLYEKASEEAETASIVREKADQDPNSTRAKMEKVHTLVHMFVHTLTTLTTTL